MEFIIFDNLILLILYLCSTLAALLHVIFHGRYEWLQVLSSFILAAFLPLALSGGAEYREVFIYILIILIIYLIGEGVGKK